jgi:hypothetical protein
MMVSDLPDATFGGGSTMEVRRGKSGSEDARKLVPTLEAAHHRIYTHSLTLGDASRKHSQVGKILKIHQELPSRIHIVLLRQQVGF